ncbi:MAG: pyrimidine dimer DNA glycosylase/endonuclease V [Nitrososphaerota archaeon]|nr:pyrimidine dimer DNA glycosylase/endonuclease V [Nitrososphaerota archaeon]
MRLWSIHPEYLDIRGLIAVWREGLLAKAVLEGRTRGYVNHPQLVRFKGFREPLKAINTYLHFISIEGIRRGFRFDLKKIDKYLVDTNLRIPVTEGQLYYEYNLLINKLLCRDPIRGKVLLSNKNLKPHPIFYVIHGDVERWERIKEIKYFISKDTLTI